MTSDITTHTTTPPAQISLSEPSPLSVSDMIFECPLKLFNITYFNALTKCNKCIIQIYYTKKLTEVIESIFLFRISEIRKFDRAWRRGRAFVSAVIGGSQFVLIMCRLWIANHTVSHCTSSSGLSEFPNFRNSIQKIGSLMGIYFVWENSWLCLGH